MVQNIRRFYSPLIDLLSFLILIGVVVYVTLMYGQLPDQVPTHFNAAGEVTTWSGKGSIVGLLVLYSFLVVSTFMLNYFLIVRSEDTQESLTFLNVPFVKKDELTERQIFLVKKYSARMLAIINLFMSGLFGYIIYGMIQNALGMQSGLGAGMTVLIVLLLVIPFVYMIRLFRDLKDSR